MSRNEPRSHAHPHPGSRRALVTVLAITVATLGAEIVGAVVSGSLALLADAGHVLTDVAGLVMALTAAGLATRPATDRLTWGYRRVEVLAAATQAVLLLAVGVYILIEAGRRFVDPAPVESTPMLVFGFAGLAGNVAAIAVLLRHRATDLNLRAAFLDVVGDALGSVAVIVAAVLLITTGWLRADALASATIGLLIVPRTWQVLREAVHVLLEATPRGVDLAAVRSHLLDVPHVRAVHDLHASTVATGLPVLTAHVVVDDDCFHDGHLVEMLDDVQRCLAGHFDVAHSTFQFEPASHRDHEHAAHV